MKFEILPVEVSDLVPFSPSSNFNYGSKSHVASFAGISKNGLWLWIVCDTSISIYHAENSEWFGGYCFGQSLKNPAAKITAVTEFASTHVAFPCLLIVVNNDNESLICIYNINISKVVRAVLLPDLVFTIEVISANGGACVDTLHLFTQLRYMFGIVAVGTSSGKLYFLDLCLDEDFKCNENLPNITFVTKKYDLLPENREKVISKQQHIFMQLNDQSAHVGSFEYESRSSSLGYFSHGKIPVTAMKYIQSTVSLAAGYKFGGIQIWDLQDLCLLYSVANQSHELPIVAFAFQEPENDPRHFCYLWVFRGYSSNERPEDFSTATMYSLIYEKRTYVNSFGYLYMDLKNCTKRFEYTMTSDPFSSAQSSSAMGSCLVSCQTVCQTDELHLDVLSANDSDIATENLCLCVLSWVVWSNLENGSTSYHFALFDLNQWYRAEMPSSNNRCDQPDLNPYFAHFSLEEAAQIFDLEPVLGVYVIPHSIKKFKCITPSEEFFFPSSLDFQTMLFSTYGTCKAKFMGLQKRILYEIGDMGPNALINPKRFFNDLIRSGLIPDIHSTCERVPLIMQRETLLQLALEYHLPFFFMKCLKEWGYADSIQEGCTSRALLNWVWKKVAHIKSSLDKLNIPLFNCSGCDIDKSSLKCLYSYRRQLDLIDTIFMGYEKYVRPRTDQGIQELKCRKDVVFSINMYLQVILWLRSVRVLPEVVEGEETEKNVSYPVNSLIDSYIKRRNHLQKIHSSIGATDILLIDGLVKETFSENTWPEKGGNGLYPPPSIYAALSCYLMDDERLQLKHSLLYYLLLDICNASQNVDGPLVEEVKKFPTVFRLPQSYMRLVEAFWYLDQFNFEVAINKLLHPSIKASEILQWQHHRIIKSFLFQGEARKALKYINYMEPPEITLEDMKLHLSVLLARGAIMQAFHYQRSKEYTGFGKDLLNHLFSGCQEMHQLKEIMYMLLNPQESSMLVQFLSENEDPRMQEALVMYQLLRCNFFEAAKVNEKLSINVPNKFARNERTLGRDALVEGLLASVPKAERNLVQEINRSSSYAFRPKEKLKPLSLCIKTAPLKQITYSDILNSLLTEASSIMYAPYLLPQTPLKSGSYFDAIPFLRPPLSSESVARLSPESFHSTPVTKRILASPTSEFSSPSKKSRLLDNAPFRTPLSKRKVPKHLLGDVASLLQSPPIPRRSSSHVKEAALKDSTLPAPQSILKKKIELNKLPVSDDYTSKTPSVLSDAGEDSDDLEKYEMVVDGIEDDVPGRQIRFSVPNNEDLNISASSNVEVELMTVSNTSKELANSVTDSIHNPHLECFDQESREFVNVSRRQTLQNLTREPLKSHSRDILRTQLFSGNKPTYENPAIISTNSSCDEQKPEEESDSDSCYTIESSNDVVAPSEGTESRQVASMDWSSHTYMSTPQSEVDVKESKLDPKMDTSDSEFVLNKSNSSANSSCYTSASERSLIITPRKPLRHNSRDSSFSEIAVSQKTEKEQVEQIVLDPECEIIIHQEEEDISNTSDEDISIIGEVGAPLQQATTGLPSGVEDDSSVSQDNYVVTKTTTQVIETADDQEIFSGFAEVGKCDFADTFISKNFQLSSEQQIIDEQSENSDEAEIKDDVLIQNECIVQSCNDVLGGHAESQTSEEQTDAEQDVDFLAHADNEIGKSTADLEPKMYDFSASIECKTDEPAAALEPKVCDFATPSNSEAHVSPPDLEPETYFAKEIPAPSVSLYVPLKERVSRSQQNISELSRYEDETYPSLLLQEHLEMQKCPEAFEIEKSSIGKKQCSSNLQSSVKPVERLQTLMECDMDSGTLATERTCRSAISKKLAESKDDLSQKLTQRFDFLSKNKEFYENNKLYKETMNLLKGNDIPEKLDSDAEKRFSMRRRTYFFGKGANETQVNVSGPENFEFKSSGETSKEFLESWHPETYEQFSDTIHKGRLDEGQKETLKSSPNIAHEKNPISIFEASYSTEYSVSESISKKKPDSAMSKKSKPSIKKAKEKGKKKKMEFSFAEPHSPAGPEILEALTTPSQCPVGSFIFSPPHTRGRMRQKKMDDSLSSSFASAASETSFARTKKPPVDPILEEIVTEKAPESKHLESLSNRRTKSSAKKKTVLKKPAKADVSQMEVSDASINVSRLIETDSPGASPLPPLSSAKPFPKHKMVLRQTKGKSRTAQLF